MKFIKDAKNYQELLQTLKTLRKNGISTVSQTTKPTMYDDNGDELSDTTPISNTISYANQNGQEISESELLLMLNK
jgi:hypothetical protein